MRVARIRCASKATAVKYKNAHLKRQCKHGTIAMQCRRFSPDKRIEIVPCPPHCKEWANSGSPEDMTEARKRGQKAWDGVPYVLGCQAERQYGRIRAVSTWTA